MRKLVLWILPVLLAANGLFMLLAPAQWYPLVPGAAASGPFNPHFVRDIGAAYLASAVGLGWWAADRRGGAGAVVTATAFLAVHMLIHIFDAFAGHGHGLGDVGRDLVGVYLPPLIAIWISWRALSRKEA